MKEVTITPEQIKQIYKEYQFDLTNIEYDDEMVDIFQKFENLTEPEKLVMVLYAELRSQRKVAALLKVSRTGIVKYLENIRKKILEND